MSKHSEPRPMWRKSSWTPVRRGPIFCSPACGAGCTKAEYDLKNSCGAKIAGRLGPGWKAVVHEDGGWNLSVNSLCGRIHIVVNFHQKRRDRIAGYSAFLNSADKQPGGRWVGHGKTPQAAIAGAVAQALASRSEIDAILKGLV